MWNISYDLNKLVSPNKAGYEFLQSFRLFIPYKEVGLQLLVRKEQILPFFYEIILKLVDCKCYEISHISEVTGVEQEILYNVVGEMSRSELIYIKSNVLILTPKGKLALSELKKVLIEKEVLNRIFINSITGEIIDLEQSYKKPIENNPCLFEIVRINNEYIFENFDDFNEYYKKRQEVFEDRSSSLNIKNEIYQIIGKEYERLCYSEVKASVYKNIRDNDLVYECESDIDNIYGTIFSKQVNSCTGARSFLKRYSDINKYLHNKVYKDAEKENNTENLVNLINKTSFSNKELPEELERYYFSDRYLLEKEYIEILYLLKDLKPSEIIMSSGNLTELLKNDIIALLQASLDNTRVSIISDSDEWRIGQLKEKVINHKQKKKNKIEWIEKRNLIQTDIVLFPYCAISVNYIPMEVGRDYLVREFADITFEMKKIQEIRDGLLKVALS